MVFSQFVSENERNSKFPKSGIFDRVEWSAEEAVPMYKQVLSISVIIGTKYEKIPGKLNFLQDVD